MKSLSSTVLLSTLVLSLLPPAVVPFDFKSLVYKTPMPCFSKRAAINCVDEEPTILHPDWMSSLSDDLRLNRIAIPGTHQSASLHGGFVVQCQVWDIGEQLRAGIRFLDIRIKFDPFSPSTGRPNMHRKKDAPKTSDGILGIYHGPIYQLMSFEEVLGHVRKFLGDNPRETVLMKVNEELFTDERGGTDFTEELTRVLDANADMLWCCDYIPFLKEIRGRIVIIRRYGDFPAYGIGIEAFRMQNYWDIPTLWHLETKMDKFKKMMMAAVAGGKASLPVINYASASGWAANPYMIARKMNTFVLTLLEEENDPQRVGIIPIDFPGYGIIKLIIDKNLMGNETTTSKGPKDYGSCRSQWNMASFTCKVTRDRCARGHSVIQAWQSLSCKCSCVNDADPHDKGCNTVREKLCE